MSEKTSLATTISRFVSLDEIPDLPTHLLDHDARRGAFPGARNALGYRGDEFDGRADINIAFVGCSWCEGMGVELSQIHSEQTKLILQDLTNQNVRSWNFGLAGTGIDYIARMVPIICHSLRPDFFVVILSNGNRREFFTEDGRRINYYPAYKNHADLFVPEEDNVLRSSVNALDSLGNPHDEVVKYIVQFRGISGILNSYGIPWAHSWTTGSNGRSRWQHMLSEAGAWDYSNFLGTPFQQVDVASEDDSHPGVQSHRRFAETVANWILKELPKSNGGKRGGHFKTYRNSFVQRLKSAAGLRRPTNASGHKPKETDSDESDVYPMW